MRRLSCYAAAAAAVLAGSASANAAVFSFNTDPFAGSNARTTLGRQVVGNGVEPSISFDIGSDVFAVDPAVFGIGGQISFVNALAAGLPKGGVNVVVLQSTDNDNNPATPFAAGNAANLIATAIEEAGAGFFIYFNSGLDLPRLVFSTDLSDPNADLKIIARMTNLAGQPDALANFTAENFALVPEPSSLLLFVGALLAGAGLRRRVTT